jgi:hypothetical protein
MTPDPVVLDHDDTIAVAIHKMAVGGFRHIPIVDGEPGHSGSCRPRTCSATSPRRSTDGRSGPRRIAVLADDLIWSTRLARQLRAAGGEPVPRSRRARVRDALVEDADARGGPDRARLRRHRGDRSRRRAGRPVLAVGQHDDHAAPAASARAAGAIAGPRLPQAVRGRATASWPSGWPAWSATTVVTTVSGAAGAGTGFPRSGTRRASRAGRSRPDGRPRRAAHRHGPGPALPDRLRGPAARAPHDARRSRPGRDDRRPAPGGARGRPNQLGGRPVRTWDETDDAYALVAELLAVRTATRHGSPSRTSSGPATCSASRLRSLRRAPSSPASLVPPRPPDAQGPDEIALLRRAAQAADRVVPRSPAGRLVGRTEADVAREVRERLVAEGHDEGAFAIVARAQLSASPHHDAGERVIRPASRS